MSGLLKPIPALRDVVRYYGHLEEWLPSQTVVQPVPARTSPVLEFTFGRPFGVMRSDSADSHAANLIAVIGPQTYQRVQLVMSGHVEVFVIVFQPGGFSRLFSVPVSEIANNDFEGRAVLGPAVEELARRLGDLSSFVDRARCAERFLLSLYGATSARQDISACARNLQLANGGIRVSKLADQAGLSIRQFERRFLSQIGVSPKMFARVSRFEAALKFRTESPNASWMEIAHQFGYFDQMHLVREFREFSNFTPKRAELRFERFVGPEIDLSRQ